MAGHVILLNGTPSSGKTTLARALHETLEPPHWYRSLDDFSKGYLPKHWDPHRGPWQDAQKRELFREVLHGYLRSLREMARVGHPIISEAVILPSTRELYVDSLSGLEVFLFGVRCPLPVAQAREAARTDRVQNKPIPLDVPEFELVHSHGPYDAEVDTSAQSVADCVAIFTAALERTPSAFARLRAQAIPAEDERECLFCLIVAGRSPAHVVHETNATIAFLDQLRQPTDAAHVLVIPKAHVENIYAVDDALGAELFAAHALVARAVKRAFAPEGITTWSSNERGANQEIPHFHLHVYPRRVGVPYPPIVMRPETPVRDEVLVPSADRLRRAIAELRTTEAR
jgi:diadenosine tetraphosphate (Ap4A) HIT family hydrolase/chloramphenicol 3-O-phosphotransferase